jgi:nucleotide-binding universal stress UspA family protein
MTENSKNHGDTGAAKAAFGRVVCGIDGSPAAEEAAREVGLLAPDGGHMFLVGVVDPGLVGSLASALPGGTTAAEDAGREAARSDLAGARSAVRDEVEIATAVSSGPPGPMLEAEARRVLADTVAVGSHGYGRTVGIVIGSVATWLIHNAACSVLVARAPAPQPFPASILVGLDGSDASLQALESARELAGRVGAPLHVLHVLDGRFPAGALQRELGLDEEIEEIRSDWSAPEGLSEHVGPADLLVVGSRGLHGIRALGSVSEAVAHRAPSSVLVVR